VTETSTQPSDEGVWDRLRRRKLVQWIIAYVAGAWGLLQGIAYMRDTFGWPHQLQQAATVLLLIGLPVVLVLAWYHGDRGQRQITRTELAILTLLFLLGGGIFWYFQRTSETATIDSPSAPSAAAFATDRSIAVLPFVNMSADKEQEYFADGISEELLNLLAQVPELRVIARTSSFSFKGKEVAIAEIARTLNVANVLEGSVRKSGDTLRITAQLVRASDSSHLWSQTYDRQMTDVFKVQDEIASAVVEQLKIRLLGAVPNVPATDPQAYSLFLQGRQAARQLSAVSLERAIDLYEQVLAIDPAYAPAWDGLASTYFNQMDLALVPLDEGLPRAEEAIKQTLKSDPQYAPAYARLALVAGVIERDLAASARHLARGLAIDPVNLEVIDAAVPIARRLGRRDKAIALAEYLIARDPVNVSGRDRLAFAYRDAGRLDDAIAQVRTALKLSPDFASEHALVGELLLLKGDPEAALTEIQEEPIEQYRLVGLSMAYNALGRKADSDAALEELIRKHHRTMAFNIAYVFAERGETDHAFEWLEKAMHNGDLGLGAIAVSPLLQSLHSDSRWEPLLRRLGMAPEQLAAIKFDVSVPK